MRKYDELQLKFEIEGWDEAEEDAQERAISYQEARQISEAAFNGFRERIARIGDRPG